MMNRVREGVLWTGAVLGVLCIAWTIVMFAFGLTPLVFTSGSMSPQIDAGDLAFSRTIEASQIEVDDVVSVVNDKGVRITHRVVRVDPTEDGAVVTLKGDANQEADVEPYTVTSVERVSFSVPKAGYLVKAVSSPVGMFAGGLLAATALFIAFGRGSGGTTPPPRIDHGGDRDPEAETREDPAAHSGRRVLGVSAAAMVLGAAAVTPGVQPTAAAFSDSGSWASGTLGTTVTAPSQISCSGGGFGSSSIVLRWPHVDARYDYRVVTRDENGAVLSTISVPTGTTAVGQPVSATITRTSSLGFFWYDRTATVTAVAKGSSAWSSAGTVWNYTEGKIIAGSSVYCS